jgi:hypothetical protein
LLSGCVWAVRGGLVSQWPLCLSVASMPALVSQWPLCLSVANVERGNIADKLQPRNINVSFTNNSNVAIDILIFTFYSDQLVIDVETGIVISNIVMIT